MVAEINTTPAAHRPEMKKNGQEMQTAFKPGNR